MALLLLTKHVLNIFTAGVLGVSYHIISNILGILSENVPTK
jgi:hypothetical protein